MGLEMSNANFHFVLVGFIISLQKVENWFTDYTMFVTICLHSLTLRPLASSEIHVCMFKKLISPSCFA